MPKIGIIGGSGLYGIEGVEVKEMKRVTTPFGECSDDFKICEFHGIEFAFLSRHGSPHRIAPHRINYRANMWGFREMGAERIVAVNAVGGINREAAPGDIMIPDQIIDMTEGRQSTFYEEDEVVHVDFTFPFCPELRGLLTKAGKTVGLDLKETGTYVCTNGPRLETKAEISSFQRMGGDMVGMTAMPEACLARELEVCFAGIAVITNYAAGISERPLTVTEVVETMKTSMVRIKDLLKETLKIIPEERGCECRHALRDARL